MTVETPTPASLGGQTIKGYELHDLIGEGGFGVVYRAYQPAVRREVVIKAILPEFANHPEFIRRFETEAQLVARLEHIHIVPLYDYWRDANGAFLVMRWLRGGSLRAALEKANWPLDDMPRLMDQITAALAAAHAQGVIHRDLKPDNILLDENNNAYLADFGIAKDLQDLTNALYIAEEQQGIMLGSPYYLSPEQIKGDPVSAQSDIYSLGIMLYEILVGKNPFHGLPLSTVITKHLEEPLPHFGENHPHLPDELNRVIAKATQKEPAHRYTSVIAFNTDFRQAIALSEGGLALPLREENLTPEELERLGITDKMPARELGIFEPLNPYKGLRAFQEADADDFYGRDALVERLIDGFKQDAARRFLAVVGPSGSGKSSVVKAGLLPQIRQDVLPGSKNWFIIEMTPGTHPLEELEAALLRIAVNPPATLLAQLKDDERGLVRAVKRILPTAETELVIVIDQFEEVFTQVESEAERLQFLNILAEAARDAGSRLRVIATLRADFYDRPLLYAGFGELVRETTEVVLPMTRQELERAIVEPAERAGLELENGLVTAIMVDVGEQPEALPLLQFALTELYERREGRWLTLNAYNEIGGVSGALARRADELYQSLDAAGQKTARQMFLRLVTLNEGAEDTRRRARLDELLALQGDDQMMQKVVDLFGKYRLLTFDRDPATRTPTVEVAHEALIRQWQELRGWLQRDREGMRMQRRLTAAVEEWQNANRDRSYLATGSRLDQFEVWSKDTELALTATEAAYLNTSLSEREKQRAAEAARQAQEAALQRRVRNFLVALVAVMAVATVGALGLWQLAQNQGRIAEENAATATFAQGDALVQAEKAATAAAVAQISAAEARSLAFASGAQLALTNYNTDLAILLALEANQNGQSTLQTQRTLAEAAYAPGTRRVFTGHDGRPITVTFSPDGQLTASGARDDNTALIWEVATGAILHRLVGHQDFVWDVTFSPDGKSLLTASQDQTLMLWDVNTGEHLRTFEGHTGAVRSISFSADGETALSASEDASLILWDIATGEVVREMQSGGPVYDVAYSKSGFTAISGGLGTVITLWNIQSGEPLTQFGVEGVGHSSDIMTLAYLPDETGMLTGSDDDSLILWSFESGQPVRFFAGHSTRVTNLAISLDGQRAVSVSEDNAVLVWDIGTAAIMNRFTGHTAPIYGAAFAPDGEHIMSASWDGTLRLWDLQNGAQTKQLNAQDAAVLTVAYSPDGQQVLAGLDNGSVVLWDMTSGQTIHTFTGHTGGVNSVAYSSDGQLAVSGSDDFSLILWDVESGERIRQLGSSSVGHSDAVWAVAFSPDGKMVASGARDNTIILWDVASGEAIQRLFGHTFRIAGLTFSPDGQTLLSSSFDTLLILWNVVTGQEIRRFEGHRDWVRSVAFSPDGKTFVSGSADNTMIWWDVESGERLRQYEGHSAQIYSVNFSQDGQFALSGSADASVILWDLRSGAQVRRFAGHGDDVRSVAFSPDQRYALSGSSDGTVRQWQITLALDNLVAWTQANRYVRELTCAERELYGVTPLCAAPTPIIEPGSV